MISDDRAQRALVYLAETDEEAAQLRADTERAEHKARAIKDAIFRHLGDEKKPMSVADRMAAAGSSEEYGKAMNEYFDSLRQSEYVRNKRQTESIVIDVYRTIQANRRMSG